MQESSVAEKSSTGLLPGRARDATTRTRQVDGMLTFVEEHYTVILIAAIIIVLASFILCLMAKLMRAAIGLVIAAVLIPLLFTIFWGDGSKYVSQFASLFEPEHQHQIEEAYHFYKEKDSEDPLIDCDDVSDAVTDIFADAKDDLSKRLPIDAGAILDRILPPDKSDGDTDGGTS